MSFIRQKNNLPPAWHIICDFDGTISRKDTTDQLLNHFARDGWLEIEKQWEDGLIGSKVCMQQQIALLDMSETAFHHCLDQIEIDYGFLELVQFAAQFNLQLSIVSDGLDQVIRYILKKHNLAHLPIIANKLTQCSDRSWQLAFPYAQKDCISQSGTCKCNVAQHPPQHRVLLIGDGRSDFCLAAQADYVFAKKSLIKHCQDKHIPHRAFENLSELIQPITQLLQDHNMHYENDRLATS